MRGGRGEKTRGKGRSEGGRGRRGGRGRGAARAAGGAGGAGSLTKVKGVLRSVMRMSATARLTMKRLVAECIRWFLKMT